MEKSQKGTGGPVDPMLRPDRFGHSYTGNRRFVESRRLGGMEEVQTRSDVAAHAPAVSASAVDGERW